MEFSKDSKVAEEDAFLAGLIFPALGFAVGGGIFASIFHATIGAVILLFLIGLVKRA